MQGFALDWQLLLPLLLLLRHDSSSFETSSEMLPRVIIETISEHEQDVFWPRLQANLSSGLPSGTAIWFSAPILSVYLFFFFSTKLNFSVKSAFTHPHRRSPGTSPWKLAFFNSRVVFLRLASSARAFNVSQLALITGCCWKRLGRLWVVREIIAKEKQGKNKWIFHLGEK